ncbi:glycosyltransferase [Paenibacillus sp. y28]|uniref:glycosyltransferase n=1 Tax=Paenibacillus sp. y28 TaxID=3129110 RepID=UPI003018121C
MQHIAVIYNAGGSYSAIRNFSLDLVSAFRSLGFVVHTIDYVQAEAREKLEQLLDQNVLSFLVGMNGMGIEQLYERLYFGHMPAPFFAYLVDHPMHHVKFFNFFSSFPNLIVSCVDQTHASDLAKFFNPAHRTAFIPHAASHNTHPFLQPCRVADRKTAILFAGSYTDVEACRNEWLADPYYKPLMEEIMEAGLYQYKESLLTIAENVFHRQGISFDYRRNKRVRELLVQLEFYLRGRRRNEVLERLADFPIQVYSDCRNRKIAGKHIRFCPAVDYSKLFQLYGDTKLALNVFPYVIYGGHDRLFNSMMSGAVALTERNLFLEEHFIQEEHLVMYDASDPDLAEKVELLLTDTDKLEYISNQGKEIVKQQHTWLNRAREIARSVLSFSSRG